MAIKDKLKHITDLTKKEYDDLVINKKTHLLADEYIIHYGPFDVKKFRKIFEEKNKDSKYPIFSVVDKNTIMRKLMYNPACGIMNTATAQYFRNILDKYDEYEYDSYEEWNTDSNYEDQFQDYCIPGCYENDGEIDLCEDDMTIFKHLMEDPYDSDFEDPEFMDDEQ